MKRLELPVAWQRAEERALIALVAFGLFLGPFLLGWSGLRRESLLSKIPASESNAPFLVREIYNDKSPIDLLFIGPCTVWWQIEVRTIQRRLAESVGRPVEVVSLGYNHFGSDLDYLILRDLLARRQVRNVAFSLPKIEDIKEFPHQNAIGWWIYPRDAVGIEGLSWKAHIRLFGLAMFSTVSRAFLPLGDSPEVTLDEGGFRADRPRDENSGEVSAVQSSGLVTVSPLKTLGGAKNLMDSDWLAMTAATARLLREKDVHVFFVDSPHPSDFERADTTAWGFEEFFPEKTNVILTNFAAWRGRLPEEERPHLIQGENLSPAGAAAFTRLIADAVVREVRP